MITCSERKILQLVGSEFSEELRAFHSSWVHIARPQKTQWSQSGRITTFLLPALNCIKIMALLSLVSISGCGGGGGVHGELQQTTQQFTSTTNDVQADSGSTVATSGSSVSPMDGINVLLQSVDGSLRERKFYIRFPSVMNKKKYPVVFFFHGAGGTGGQWFSEGRGVVNLIDSEKFIGIFPDGYDRRWNVGTESNADDVDFVRSIANFIGSSELFDLSQMYGIGTSNGAGMVNKIGKETSLFKGIAPIISQQTENIGLIVPPQAISIFQVNGTEDNLIPIDGGAGVANHVFMSAKASAENWALNFSCNSEPSIRSVEWGNYGAIEHTYNACIENRRVRYVTVDGAGHTANFGENFDLYNRIWDFFLRNDEGYYEEFFSDIYLTQSKKNLFIRNAQRFQEICLDNFTGLKNPLWQVYQTGEWPIYFHIESWDGPVTATAINRMRSDYQRIANEWIAGLRIYDPTFIRQVDVKLFGFVFNTGVSSDKTFTDMFSKYPQVRDYAGIDERSPWKLVFRDDGAQFDQNWYSLDDFSRVKVVGIGEDLSADVSYYPKDWESYQHPENIDYFLTKFWHKVSWDAVAQRQYLKLGGNVTDYELGETRYSVFAHEMGHTLFLDDIYSIDKYPDGTEISSIMNNSGSITDFDTFTMRIVWKQQKEMYHVSVDP